MTEIGPWLDPPSLHPGESLPSFASRMAVRGMVSVGEFMRLGLGESESGTSVLFWADRKEALGRLAIMSSTNADQLAENCVTRISENKVPCLKFLGCKIPWSWPILDRRRLAPNALRDQGDSPYLPLLWQLGVFPCDPETGEYLIERCPCGATLWWAHAARLWLCHNCGADVRQFPSRYAPPEVARSAKEFAGYFVEQPPVMHPDFRSLDELQLFSAMEWFGAFIGSAAGNKQLNLGAANVLRGYMAMQRWPVCLDEELDEVAALARYNYHPADQFEPTTAPTDDVIASINHFISTGEHELRKILIEYCRRTLPLSSVTPAKGKYLLRDFNCGHINRFPNGILQASHVAIRSARKLSRRRSSE